MRSSLRVPIEVGVSGHVNLKLKDTRTGEIVEKRSFRNLLLDDYLDAIFEDGIAMLHWRLFDRCYLGDDDTEAQRSDMGLIGSELAMNDDSNETVPLDEVSRYLLYLKDWDLDFLAGKVACKPKFSPDGKYLAVNDRDIDEVWILDIDAMKDEDGELVHAPWSPYVPIEGDGTFSLDWSPDGNYLAIATYDDGNVFVLDVAASESAEEPVEVAWSPLNILQEEDHFARFMAWNPNGDYIAMVNAGSVPESIIFVDVPASIGAGYGVMADFSPWEETSEEHIGWSNSGDYLSVATGSNVEFLNLSASLTAESPVTLTWDDPSRPVNHTAWSSDDQYIALSCGSMNVVHLLDVSDIDTEVIEELDWSPYSPGATTGADYMDYGMWLLGDRFLVTLGGRRQTSWPHDSYAKVGLLDFHDSVLRGEPVLYAQGTTTGPFIVGRGSHRHRYGARSSDGTVISRDRLGNVYLWQTPIGDELDLLEMGRSWDFPAGVGTGTIREIAMRASSFSVFDNNWVARQVIDPPLEKSDYHELIVEWILKVTNPTKTWSGTIDGGGREGEDINWTATIGNRALHDIVGGVDLRNALRRFYDATVTPYALTGDSNDPTDPAVDAFLLGNRLDEFEPFDVDPEDYTAYQRAFRVTIGLEQSNGDIGELILRSNDAQFLGRFTFDPPLSKIDTYRLHLDLEFKLDPNPE